MNLKFLRPFKEADGRADFSIVDNTSLATRARARARRVTHRPRGSPEIPSVTPKGSLQFPSQHCDFSIVDHTELITRARGEFCIVHNGKVGPSVGLLKGPQKFQIQFLELHGGFSIVDNTELPARARARCQFCIAHNRKIAMLAWKLK